MYKSQIAPLKHSGNGALEIGPSLHFWLIIMLISNIILSVNTQYIWSVYNTTTKKSGEMGASVHIYSTYVFSAF